MIQIVHHRYFCDAYPMFQKHLWKKWKGDWIIFPLNVNTMRYKKVNGETRVFDELLFWNLKIRARKFDESSISFSSSRYIVFQRKYGGIFCSMPSGLANIFQYRNLTQQTDSILATHFLRKVRTHHRILFLRMQIIYVYIYTQYVSHANISRLWYKFLRHAFYLSRQNIIERYTSIFATTIDDIL